MKRYFYFSLLTLLVTACFTPAKDCSKFKTGTFEYQTYADGELIKAKIVRNDSLEIDYYNPQEPDTSAIRWVNDCEYILRKYGAKAPGEKQSFKMRIIETEENHYTFQFSQVGEIKVKEFTATRIQEED